MEMEVGNKRGLENLPPPLIYSVCLFSASGNFDVIKNKKKKFGRSAPIIY
jgi:hypothetical protein